MPCHHKFIENLNCLELGFQPQILIIGTFNPEWPLNNYASWFYGRTNNNYFWDVLPRMFGDESLRHSNAINWKNYCSDKRIAITDLISSINDADQENPSHFEIISKFKDTEFAKTFNHFEMTDVIQILENNSSIEKVFFTRNSGVELFDAQIQIVREYCQLNDIYFSNLLTPSGNARYQMGGWNPQMLGLERNLRNFIFEKWISNWD
jgi:hypothetical protein